RSTASGTRWSPEGRPTWWVRFACSPLIVVVCHQMPYSQNSSGTGGSRGDCGTCHPLPWPF
ncbi:MAG: hypothetical protein ACOVRM_11425, partial [Planctomycetaceae bacterium]